MATPAQVANDMAAHARYWAGRDKVIASTCTVAAQVIFRFVEGGSVDGRTYAGIHRRLLKLEGSKYPWQGFPDFQRARLTLERLRAERTRG